TISRPLTTSRSSQLLSPLISLHLFSLFFFHAPPTTDIYTLSLHDALPISLQDASRGTNSARESERSWSARCPLPLFPNAFRTGRSEEHTSELQSRFDLVCRLLLEKKKKNIRLVLFKQHFITSPVDTRPVQE